MNSKEKCIAEAYGEYPLLLKHIKGKNGWSGDKFGVLYQKYKDNPLFEVRHNEYGTNGTIRPKSLQGIENNNGWQKIESEADLPKEFGTWHILTKGNGQNTYTGRLSEWGNRLTHYQPIEKPKPPLH